MVKEELWTLIESHVPRLSDDIGWGSMDSLCEDIITLLNDALLKQAQRITIGADNEIFIENVPLLSVIEQYRSIK